MPEETGNQTFREAMEQMLGRSLTEEEVLAAYEAGPDDLEDALEGLDDADLDLARAPNKWTVRQIVHHIVDGDAIWDVCLKAAIGNPGCTYSMGWYDQDPWAEALDYARREIPSALAVLRANRRHIVRLLRHLPDVWERRLLVTWPHLPEGRELSVHDILCIQTVHVPWHVDQIRETRQVHRR
ncbi:MAG: DinB family protein [Chloroflexi bacterium]|nr:DinB family protein [Chloroflexota bacterium]